MTPLKQALALAAAWALLGTAQGATVTIPVSALNPSPGVYTAGGYYTDSLGQVAVMTGGGNAANVGLASGRNDDGYMVLNLGFDFTFFGTTYSSLYLNNNGNVSFGAGISAYVPTGPTGADQPLISPFFGDVDTRNDQSGVLQYNLQAEQLIVTWDAVGSFNSRGSPFNSFQLVIRSDDYAIPVGEGKIGFFYQEMGWERTATSQTAAVGFGDGVGNAEVLAGSNTPGMAAIVNNRYIWFDANLDPVDPNPVPLPGTLALASLAIAGLFGARSRRR